MIDTSSSRKHLVPLRGSSWSLWRDAVLRSAGFPARDILILHDAVAAGNVLFILGALYLARNTLEGRCFIELHPRPARLMAAQEADTSGGRFVAVQPKDPPHVTSRTATPTALLPPNFTSWPWSDSRASFNAPGCCLPAETYTSMTAQTASSPSHALPAGVRYHRCPE